jgi:4-amino-4-deoxy-L-arabinose transferase-like glycosyltransferase
MIRDHKLTILVLILVVGWGALTIRIGAPWVGHQDGNGAWISTAIRNYERYGFGTLGGMVALDNSPVQPDNFHYYPNHPPFPVWLPSLPVLLFGYHEVLVRFVFAACSLLSIAAFYALTRRLFGNSQAISGTAFYAFTPMLAYFGRMPDHEAPALLLLLLFAWVMVLWLHRPSRVRGSILAALIVAQAWTAWGGLICVFGVCAGGWWLSQGRQRVSAFILAALGVIGAFAVVVFYQLQWSGSIGSFVDSFLWRTSNQTFVQGSEPFTWGQYVVRQLFRLITLFTPTIGVIAVLGIVPVLRETSRLRKAIPLALLLGGVCFVLLFRNASYIHDYYLVYITPAAAIFAAYGLHYWWQQRRTQRWMRPLLVGLLVATPIASIRYLDQLYQGSDQTEPLVIAQAIEQHTEATALIMSNLPSVGLAIDFYASRDIMWEIAPEEAAARRDEREFVYYFHCGAADTLPANTSVISEIEISPQCWLMRLS